MIAHYERTGVCKTLPTGERVFQIRVTQDNDKKGVRAGEKGGWVGEHVCEPPCVGVSTTRALQVTREFSARLSYVTTL